MALVLTLRPKENVYIGETKAFVEVPDFNAPFPWPIRLNVAGKVFEVTDEKKTEVMPDVFVSAGVFNEEFVQYRLLIDAPRSIPIVRENMLKPCPAQ